jgi:hypothetical protein
LHRLSIAPQSVATAGASVFMVLDARSNTMDRFMPTNKHEVLFAI